MRFAGDPQYLAGATAFEHGDYFAAHEDWEAVWRRAAAADRPYLHSLIQAAVGLYHAQSGNRGGSERLRARGRAKAAGIECLTAFWHSVDAVADELLAQRQPPPPEVPPCPASPGGSTHDR